MRNLTRAVKIGSVTIGGNNLIAVQTMASTHTTNIKELIEQIKTFENVGADIARIAIDSKADVEALKVIRENTTMNLAVDIQENYRLIELIANNNQFIGSIPNCVNNWVKLVTILVTHEIK